MGGKVLELYSEKLEREANERIEKAHAEGLSQGITEGITQGITQGELNLLTQLIETKVKAGKSLEQIASEVERDVEEIRELYLTISKK